MSHTKSRPLYQIIYDKIKQDIEADKYHPNDQLPTEVELATMFDVSVITSKRALSELQRDGYIHRTRGKGTFINTSSRSVLQGSDRRTNSVGSNMVSIVLPSQGHGFAGYIRGAADFLNKNGYYLSVHTTDESIESHRKYLSSLQTEGVHPIIYYPTNHLHDWETLVSMHFNHCAVITIDQYIPGLPLPSVVSDNFIGGYSGTKRLIELGHRRIAYVSSTRIEGTSTIRERFLGYCSALHEYGISVDPNMTIFDYVMGATVARSTSGQLSEQMLSRMQALKATAIVAEHDFLAYELLKAASRLNIQVPDELSIVGFDDLELSAHLPAPLSTVRQNFYDIGRKAAEIAIEWMEKGTPSEVQTHVVPVEFIERGTTSRVNSGLR